LRQSVQLLRENMGRRERRMTAQIHLGRRSEPPQFVIGRAPTHYESRLGKIVLRRDRLHQILVDPLIERHNRRRIPGERTAYKRIHDVLAQSHRVTVARPDGAARGDKQRPHRYCVTVLPF
jgi:hypothetical protein